MRICITITFLLTGLLHCELPWLRVGIGGSVIGQRYSILEQDTITLTSEGKFLLDGNYNLTLGAHKLLGEFSSDIGDKSIWSHIRAKWKFALGTFDIEGSEIVEGRIPYEDVSDIVGYGRHRFNLCFSQHFGERKLSARVWMESKQYKDKSDYYYNYDLLRSKISYQLPLFGGDCNLSWSYSFRNVPDSASANYDRKQLQLSVSKLWQSGHWGEFWIEYDREHFPSETEIGSYYGLWTTSQLSIVFRKLMLELALETDIRNYDVQNDIFFNYKWFKLEATIGTDWNSWNFSAGPAATTQITANEYPGEAYADVGLKLSANCLNYTDFWMFITVEPGRRIFFSAQDAELTFSDYNFVDITFLGSIALWKTIRADASASYLPEWHTKPGDDITTSYFSLAIRYEFY